MFKFSLTLCEWEQIALSLELSPLTSMLKSNIGLERGGLMLSLYELQKKTHYSLFCDLWLQMIDSCLLYIYIYIYIYIYYIYIYIYIYIYYIYIYIWHIIWNNIWLIDIINFKNLNVQYVETICWLTSNLQGLISGLIEACILIFKWF